jgi:C4-dicarboxylate-specific signal transduction histidine kinase
MLYAVHETSAVTATTFAERFQPAPPRLPEKPVCGREKRCHETQTGLAHASRVAIPGPLSASIAHEIKQPICAVVINAQAALRLLRGPPTNMKVIRQLLACIIKEGTRAGDIVDRTQALVRKAPLRKERLEINAVILEAIDVTHGEIVTNAVSVRTKLAEDLPLVLGDRIQLQQVIINLIINAVDAMSQQAAGARDLLVRATKTRSGGVLVSVRDSGPGIATDNLDRIFDAFFSTKADGLGIGLSICRAIIQAHGGRLSARRAGCQGMILQFTLPASTAGARSHQT